MNSSRINKLLDELSVGLSFDQYEVVDSIKENKVSNNLYKQFDHSISYLNKKINKELIKIYSVPRELLEILLGLDISSEGFLILFGKSKLVLVLVEQDSFISFMGKTLQGNNNNKLIKLIRVSYESSEETIKIKDNSGLVLNPEDVITQILRWGLN